MPTTGAWNPNIVLGGRLKPDWDEESAMFKQGYENIGYVWLDLKDGRRLSIFVNFDRELVVIDAIDADELGGNEFVRARIPAPRQ